MKKLILLSLIALVGTSLVSAQSLSLSYENLDLSNDTLYLIGNTDDTHLEARVTVKNLTDKKIEVLAKKTEIEIVEHTENSFCWGISCYPPYIFEPTATVTIEANGADASAFIGDYSHAGYEGTSVLRYTFSVEGTPSDSVSMLVFFQVGVAGVFDWTLESNHFKAYPNPTTGLLNLEFPGSFNQKISVSVTSIIGQVVYQRQFKHGQSSAQINLSDNPKGYYFLEIRDESGNVARKKILKTN